MLGSVLPIFAGFDAFPPKDSRKVDSCFEDDRNCLLQEFDTSRVVLFVAETLLPVKYVYGGVTVSREIDINSKQTAPSFVPVHDSHFQFFSCTYGTEEHLSSYVQ